MIKDDGNAPEEPNLKRGKPQKTVGNDMASIFGNAYRVFFNDYLEKGKSLKAIIIWHYWNV